MFNESLPLAKETPKEKALFIIAIILVSFNLRPAITAVGPLIGSIREDIGISNGVAGFITTLPLLSFAVLSLIAPKLGTRFSNEMMIFIGLLILLFGILIRSIGLTSLLFIGTGLVGIGIALVNVLLPSIVKKRYPLKVGLMTGLYTMSMVIFAAIGSGISVPLAETFHLGWKNSLLVWALLAFIAMIFWFPFLRDRTKSNVKTSQPIEIEKMNIWTSAIAWQVTIFMGLQSFLFYCLIAWLPEILSYSGLNISEAGWMVAILQISGLPMAFLTPVFADRLKNQKGLIMMIGVLYIIGMIGLIVNTHFIILMSSIVLIGLARGASISLALTFIGLRAANAQEAANRSGMSQSIGYTLAAIGPMLIGFILDITHSATTPLIVFCFVIILMIVFGLGAGRNKTIFEK